MGLLQSTKDITMPQTFELGRDMSLDEILSVMEQNADKFSVPFKKKSGLMGGHIALAKEKTLDIEIDVSVKGNVVKVTPHFKENSVSVGGIRVDKNSVFRKGVQGVMDLPAQRAEYVNSVVATLKEILNA